MKEFFVQLISNSNRPEFPENAANHFKTRLPYPLHFRESGWRVGMASISLPRAPVPVTIHDATVCRFIWTIAEDYTAGAYAEGVFTLKPEELQAQRWRVTSGTTLMQYIMDRLRRQLGLELVEEDFRLVDHQTKKKYYSVFRWEGKELVIDNTDTYTRSDQLRTPPGIMFGRRLALDMGWVHQLKDGGYEVGPNLVKEVINDVAPRANDLFKDPKRADDPFYKFDDDGLRLSAFCNWRFVALDEAFENVFGSPRRPLYLYSNVGESTITGNQVTDLLREIPNAPEKPHFEPRHILYQPVRVNVMDILETQLAESSGQLVNFLPGVTSVTLHFKHE